MLNDQTQLHLLMDLPTHLHVDRVVLLELLHHHPVLLALYHQLHAVPLEVGGRAAPRHFLGEVVERHEDGGAPEAQSDDECLCADLLPARVEEEVDEALHHELLQPLAPRPRLVDQPDLLLELDYLVVVELLVVYALLQLLVHHDVCKPAHGRGEVRVAVQAQAEVALVGVQVARVDCELLDLDGLQQQQLLESVVDGLFLEE